VSSSELQSPNFSFLKSHDVHLLDYAVRAERYVLDDPNTTLIKLRQLAEELAELAAAYSRLRIDDIDGFSDLLRQLKRKGIITREMADIFHGLRTAGNAAAHEGAGTRQEALHQLKLARRLAVWFHQAFRDPDFRPEPFLLPPNPPKISRSIEKELDQLRKARWDSERRAEETEDALRIARQEQERAETRAASLYAELEAALDLAEETESRQMALQREHQARVAALEAQTTQVSSREMDTRLQHAQEAAQRFDLTEGEARECIDAQLRSRGWEADSVVRTWENGARPEAGRNQAIAFCPAGSGIADYILFCGPQAVAVIEAKRRNIDLVSALDEAGHHGAAYAARADSTPDAAIPFLYASNGRPYGGDHNRMYGVWYRDNRDSEKEPGPLTQWPTPDELLGMLSEAP
tara:strand:+ start:167 stop:1387 length:1221 start_codon:yes stop_codon:yes gene_type:complete